MKPKKLFVRINSEDKKGVLAEISMFLTGMGANIKTAHIKSTVDRQMPCDFELEIDEKDATLFLSSIGTFTSEVRAILRYELYEGTRKKHKLVLQGERNEDPKKALITTSQNLTISLIEYAKKSGSILYDIKPEVFEELIAEIFASNGFTVELTKRSRDGGKDVIALKYDLGIPSYWVIECKRYRKKVDVKLVRELFAVKEAGRYSNAVLVTTSSFTDPALDFQRSVWGLALADFNALTNWLDGYAFTESGGLYLAKQNTNNVPSLAWTPAR